MAASAKTVILEKPNLTEDWTVVLPRRGKRRRNFLRSKLPNQEQQWVPSDLEINPDRESKIMHKMQVCMRKLESSPFFCTFINQIQTQILGNIAMVLGTEPSMQMVIYGIGSIELYEPPRLQLSLAILMKKRFAWVGDIELFDPILSGTETRVLEVLGCSVIPVNEQGRRKAMKPTLFFMPHCEAELYDNLLEENWRLDTFNQMILLGNSFETYEQYMSIIGNSTVANLRKHILAARRFTKEFHVNTVSDDYFCAFHDLSWHIFSLDNETALESVK
ncbi:hypothetical protein NMG60_11023490 [Bertholletia excelsa]